MLEDAIELIQAVVADLQTPLAAAVRDGPARRPLTSNSCPQALNIPGTVVIR